MFSARKQQQNNRKQVYRSSQLQLYVHYQDGISSWDTFFLREMNYSVFLYILDNFFPKKKKKMSYFNQEHEIFMELWCCI